MDSRHNPTLWCTHGNVAQRVAALERACQVRKQSGQQLTLFPVVAPSFGSPLGPGRPSTPPSASSGCMSPQRLRFSSSTGSPHSTPQGSQSSPSLDRMLSSPSFDAPVRQVRVACDAFDSPEKPRRSEHIVENVKAGHITKTHQARTPGHIPRPLSAKDLLWKKITSACSTHVGNGTITKPLRPLRPLESAVDWQDDESPSSFGWSGTLVDSLRSSESSSFGWSGTLVDSLRSSKSASSMYAGGDMTESPSKALQGSTGSQVGSCSPRTSFRQRVFEATAARQNHRDVVGSNAVKPVLFTQTSPGRSKSSCRSDTQLPYDVHTEVAAPPTESTHSATSTIAGSEMVANMLSRMKAIECSLKKKGGQLQDINVALKNEVETLRAQLQDSQNQPESESTRSESTQPSTTDTQTDDWEAFVGDSRSEVPTCFSIQGLGRRREDDAPSAEKGSEEKSLSPAYELQRHYLTPSVDIRNSRQVEQVFPLAVESASQPEDVVDLGSLQCRHLNKALNELRESAKDLDKICEQMKKRSSPPNIYSSALPNI